MKDIMQDAETLDPLTPPPDAHRAFVQDGESFIWQPGKNIIVQKASGVLSLPLAHSFAEFFRPRLVPGACLRIFDDFGSLTQYTREAREFLTVLTYEHMFAIDVIHFLISSKVMALGVSAFKHDIGDSHVRAYSDRESFLRSYSAALHAVEASKP